MILQNTLRNNLLSRLDYIKLDPKKILIDANHSEYITQILSKKFPNAEIIVTHDLKEIFKHEDEIDFIFSELPGVRHDADVIYHFYFRALKKNGLLLLWSVGPDSFHIAQKPEWVDMHHIGDALVTAHFSDPVMDRDVMALHYDSQNTLEKDIQMLARLADRASNLETQIEVIYGQAWKAEIKKSQDEYVISTKDIKFQR